jgi:hypothetical protein
MFLPMVAGKEKIGGTKLSILSGCLVLSVFIVDVAEGWMGQWDLLLHGRTRLLQVAKYINDGEAALPLYVLDEVASCYGAMSVTVSSTT